MMKNPIILMVVPALLCASGLWANDRLNQELRLAVLAGDVALVEHLLDRGADIDARDDDGATALMWASRNDAREVCRRSHGSLRTPAIQPDADGPLWHKGYPSIGD